MANKKDIVKTIRGCEIEEKTNEETGVKYYTLWIDDGWVIAHGDLDRAISLAYVITR